MTVHPKNFEAAILSPDRNVLDALRIIDNASLQIALVVNDQRLLLGTVTDGDIRRGILSGIRLEDPVTKIMNSSPLTANVRSSRAERRTLMTRRKIHQIPVVDNAGRIVGLEHIDDVLADGSVSDMKDIPVVLMLGGEGKRLRPLTEDLPKPMISLGGKPLLETIVENFVRQGFEQFYFCVNYRADTIRNYFSDGSAFGAKIAYVDEPESLGTAGALGLLPQKPSGPFIVMNGDILTNSNFSHLVRFHEQTGVHATMCVREYQHQLPYGVVQSEGTRFSAIVEKPSQSYFINAAIYVLEPQVLNRVPKGRKLDMPNLFEMLASEGKESAVFPIREYWLDIGQIQDLEQARLDYPKIFPKVCVA